MPSRETPSDRTTTRGNLGAAAYAGIREMIVSGLLRPGERVMETSLAERLDISRTPVREAMGRLEGDGLLTRDGAGGLAVTRLSADEILEIVEIRRLLEVEAARRACRSSGRDDLLEIRRIIGGFAAGSGADAESHLAIDDRLHSTLARMARSTLLAELIANLRLKTRIFDKSLLPDRFEPGAREHIAIIDAVIDGDEDAAERTMRQHLDNAARRIIEHLKAL